MPRRIDLTGQRYGQLVVERWDTAAKRNGAWRCRCDCGGQHVASGSHLRAGRVLSCGCIRPRHGGKGTRAFTIWQGMLARCTNPRHRNWAQYGGRGLAVCERWRDFRNFVADMGEPGLGQTIERDDNDRGYEPGNCRWADRKEQARNTRRSIVIAFGGREQSLAAWAEELGCNYWKLHSRHKMGWPPERMFADLL